MKGVTYITDNKRDVLVRFHSTNLPLSGRRGKLIDILSCLRNLKDTESKDWDVWYQPKDSRLLKGRLCAIRKSKEDIELAIKKLKREASRKGQKLSSERLEYAEYVMLFTSLSR